MLDRLTARGRNRWNLLLAILVVTSLLAAACSISSNDGTDDAVDSGSSGATAAQNADEEAGRADASAQDGDSGGEMAVSERAPAEGQSGANQAESGDSSFNRLVIREAQITLSVTDVNQATAWVRELANRRNGFVLSSMTFIREERDLAEITIRVPADVFDATMNELRDAQFVEQVDREQSSSRDVSEEYVDNESRLEALNETERRYLALLSEADTIDEILRIESELNDIRAEIESITGRQNYLDEMTSMSTITVSLHPTGDDVDDNDDQHFIARIFDDAWSQARGAIEGILTLTITLGIVAIGALPLAVIAYAIYRFVWLRSRRPQPGSGPPNSA